MSVTIQAESIRSFCYTASVFILVVGCRSSEYDLAPVSGLVTLDGEPVAEARVIFEPKRTGKEALAAGPSSNGVTDEHGRYTLLTTVNEDRGAVVGNHAVTIRTYLAEIDRTRDTGRVLRKEEIPARYLEPDALLFDVPADGTDSADFALTTK